MDEVLSKVREHLAAGEEIRWHGEGVSFDIMGKDSRKGMITKMVICGIVAIAGLVFGIVQGDKWGVVIMLWVMLAALVVSPMMEARSLRNYRYFLTDRQAVLVTDSGAVQCMDLKYVDRAEVVAGELEGDTLVLGSGMLNAMKKQNLRWLAARPRVEPDPQDKELLPGMVFYSVKNPEEALACLKIK